MKLRTLGHLEDAVADETAWRRRELTTLRFDVEKSRASTQQSSLRAGVTLLYAHWEGWIKAVAKLYVDYVGQQRLNFCDLEKSFLGIALRVQMATVQDARSARVHNDFAAFVMDGSLNGRATINSSFIRTDSNLSSSVLRDIVERIGLTYAPYELLEALIDKRLVHARNTIAHGEFIELDIDGYKELQSKVVEMLNDFTKQVLQAANSEAYKRTASI